MSLQWTLIAGFLYTEIAIVILLLLPIISPSVWQKIFRSRLLAGISEHGAMFFNVCLALLSATFISSIYDTYRQKSYEEALKEDPRHDPNAENVTHENVPVTTQPLHFWWRLVVVVHHEAPRHTHHITSAPHSLS